VDATNLRRNLRLVLAVRRLGLPCVVALNMADLAEAAWSGHRRRCAVARAGPARGAHRGHARHRHRRPAPLLDHPRCLAGPTAAAAPHAATPDPTAPTTKPCISILRAWAWTATVPHTASDRIDRVVLHPLVGPLLLAVVLFLVFQAVFSWAEAPMGHQGRHRMAGQGQPRCPRAGCAACWSTA
jgi:ferrous iron transport protein B